MTPPIQAEICSRAFVVMKRATFAANAPPPPERSISATKPPMNTSSTSTPAL